ncbi:unnamed protein product [Heligmosomoides polygyrus]|uniref:Uncharacterized protein n=1 Tax=Heligmosomoides polygyrus TaxID=6339 RepID=A0A183G2Z4_HELPZ|nr:unnamed protein product [Heligmosomoides polygyrus]
MTATTTTSTTSTISIGGSDDVMKRKGRGRRARRRGRDHHRQMGANGRKWPNRFGTRWNPEEAGHDEDLGEGNEQTDAP